MTFSYILSFVQYYMLLCFNSIIHFILYFFFIFFFKQKTAYEMRISDWSSDVCSSDLQHLTGYKLPKLISFIDELPKTNVGKVLRKEQIGRASCRERVCQYV